MECSYKLCKMYGTITYEDVESCIDENIPYLIFEDDLTEVFGGYKIKPPTDYELYLIGEENTYPNCYLLDKS